MSNDEQSAKPSAAKSEPKPMRFVHSYGYSKQFVFGNVVNSRGEEIIRYNAQIISIEKMRKVIAQFIELRYSGRTFEVIEEKRKKLSKEERQELKKRAISRIKREAEKRRELLAMSREVDAERKKNGHTND